MNKKKVEYEDIRPDLFIGRLVLGQLVQRVWLEGPFEIVQHVGN